MANQRVKYPLTDEAKVAAKYLVDCWKNNDWVSQLFRLRESTTGNDSTIQTFIVIGTLDDNFDPPSLPILMELSKFKLVYVDGVGDRSWDVLLMQELQNAVNSDFEVSDYFLTVNAVGTIINGDNVSFNAPYQSAASNYGAIVQQMSSGEIADKLLASLGSNILQAESELAAAIQDLKTSIESERQPKLGRVISELGRSIQHGANTFVLIQALGFLTQVL